MSAVDENNSRPSPNICPVNDKGSLHTKNEKNGNLKRSNSNGIAKLRWGLLAKALKSPVYPSDYVDEISLRRFSTYTLFTCRPVSLSLCNGQRYLEYTAQLNGHSYLTFVSQLSQPLTAKQLSGFNNTGNICLWPSEETLAYYALCNREIFTEHTVLELGGGMSCLAGLIAAKHLNASLVHLTDGNTVAVDNVCRSLQANSFRTPVSCSVLEWDSNDNHRNLPLKYYDVILSADCLFFDETRSDLVETIWNHLSQTGVALVMAPKRGNTLEKFYDLAERKGFRCQKMVYYNERVWERHIASLNSPNYDENIHYPLLIRLTKNY